MNKTKKDAYSTEQLEYEKYYHIYNCGINGCNLFNEPENYSYFLDLYDKYISLIADTYAWVLMPNHFHLLVKIKSEVDILHSLLNSSSNLTGFENLSGVNQLSILLKTPIIKLIIKAGTAIKNISKVKIIKVIFVFSE